MDTDYKVQRLEREIESLKQEMQTQKFDCQATRQSLSSFKFYVAIGIPTAVLYGLMIFAMIHAAKK